MSQLPTASDGPVYAALAAGGLMLFACLASQLGAQAMIVFLMAGGGFILFAGLNYWVWGWRLKEDESECRPKE